MAKRVLPSLRTRESISDLIEGRLSSADGRAVLMKRAILLIVEEALEAENRDALGVEHQQVVLGQTKSADGCIGIQATMKAVPVESVQPVRQLPCALA